MPLAQRVPAVVKTGDDMEDMRRTADREGMVYIIQTLSTNKEMILPTSTFVKKLMDKQGVNTVTAFVGKLSAFGKLPKDWVAAWLVDISKGALTHQQLDLATCKNADICYQHLALITGVPTTMLVPEQLREHSAMAQFLNYRRNKFQRVVHVCSNLTSAGDYNWMVGGAFRLIFEGGRAIRVQHIDGDLADIPEHCPITTQWNMCNPWCDASCFVELAPSRHVLKSFFRPGKGPGAAFLNRKMLLEHIDDLPEGEDADEAQNVPKVLAGPEAFALSKVQKKRQSSEKAKEVLTQYREKRKRAQQISLSAPSSDTRGAA